MDVLLDFDTTGFDFSNLDNMVEITETSAPVHSEKKKRDKLAARACVLCNQAHTACDNARPCKRCVSKGISHLCRDSEPRKRGRPAKLPEQYDLDLVKQTQKRQVADAHNYQHQDVQSQPELQPQHVPMAPPSDILNFSPPPYDTLTVPGFDLDSALFPDSQSMETQDFDMSSIVAPSSFSQLHTPVPVSVLSPETFIIQSPSSSAPATPQSPQSPPQQSIPEYNNNPNMVSVEQMCSQLQITPCVAPELKFAEAQMEKVFTRLAVRAGFPAMTPEIRAIMTKMVQFYAPLIQQYGNHLLDMCPVRLLSVTQMTNEMVLPVVVAGAYRVLTANSAAYELTGLKKAQFTSTYFIFDIIHRDDAVHFIRTSVDCLVNYREFDRVKVRLTLPTGEIQCIVSETVHRAHNGIPLFSSFTIVRIDDL